MSPNTTPSPSAPEAAHESHVSPFGIDVAFVPWVLFSLITQHDTLKAAAVVGPPSRGHDFRSGCSRGDQRRLELGAVWRSAAFAVVAFTVDASTTKWVESMPVRSQPSVSR